MNEQLVLEVNDLRTQFGSGPGCVHAVRGVDLKIKKGEKVGLVGESGSGKSALALSIMGLIGPAGQVSGGTIAINGQVIDQQDERQMSQIRGANISLVYQDPMAALDPVWTIGGQMGEAIRRHNRRISRAALRARIVELLRAVEVPDAEHRLNSYPMQYSGGMRQRVLIAMAIANEPELIIADEPTTALDVTTQAQVLDLLQRLADSHDTAVLLVTHNMGVVAQFCDRVMVMYAGRIVEEAESRALFAHQAHPYTEALLKAVLHPDRLPEGRLPSIPGTPPPLHQLPVGCAFAARCPQRGEPCTALDPQLIELSDVGYSGGAACHFSRQRVVDRRTERGNAP
ncbi:ABC transporter ATP-binding protein [Amycolatopsis panacis]|uniref:ABC transporter ATP-binding protein n=1 Tax=Amycolatopsis panacis TaxID=2340917 RepID=A0A419HVE0_9PSEU|nr:ABC transporter ATP-binding protein [Amycolatopsis panacis]RJQ80831.1 ABC transporter ATP-binding protein [Amycolatopsis panacis]